LLEPDQVAILLRQHQARQLKNAAPRPALAERDRTAFEVLSGLRRELNGLVGAWHHRTGKQHGTVHAELRSACGGPASAQASAQQLQDRIQTLRRWANERR